MGHNGWFQIRNWSHILHRSPTQPHAGQCHHDYIWPQVYIVETKVNEITFYSCGYLDCGHEGRFDTRRQAISHIRCIHLKEKLFKCITWYVSCLPWATRTSVLLLYSGTFFVRRPDATRHVTTMNWGKIYECTVWYADPFHSLEACSGMLSVMSPVINSTRVKISVKNTRSTAPWKVKGINKDGPDLINWMWAAHSQNRCLQCICSSWNPRIYREG
jgi:hypothetical protein